MWRVFVFLLAAFAIVAHGQQSQPPGAMPTKLVKVSGDLYLIENINTSVADSGKEARLYEFRGHTRGDTVVHFPAARAVVMGDLLTTSEDIPLIVNYPDGGSWTDWSKSIDEVLKLDFDVAIPGHGPVVTKQQVLGIRNKMVAVRERVRAMNRDRKTQREITDTLIKEFNWGMGPSAGNIPGMMQELR